MKKIKIGDLKISVCETLDDINAKRWHEIKKYILLTETGLTIPSLKDFFTRFSAEFDSKSPSGMYRSIYDFLMSISNIEKDIDADQMIFALLTVEDNEDCTVTDINFLKEKIDKYCEAGITQGQIITYSRNFIEALIIR